jgi:hypothetical protein
MGTMKEHARRDGASSDFNGIVSRTTQGFRTPLAQTPVELSQMGAYREGLQRVCSLSDKDYGHAKLPLTL